MGKVTLKIVQKYEANSEGKRNVRLRITADRISRFSATEVYVAATAFNPKGRRETTNWIRASHPTSTIYNDLIKQKYDRALSAIQALGDQATADLVKRRIEQVEAVEVVEEHRLPGFLEYGRTYVARRGDSATTDTYVDALNAFRKFLKRPQAEVAGTAPVDDVSFEELSIPYLKTWRQWALTRYKNNTAWLYHSRLKSLYFQALEDVDGLTSLPVAISDPFRRVKIPKQKTRKGRLYEDEIERLIGLDLAWGTRKRTARDIAMMMYYAHGMRVGDALRLRASNYVVITHPAGDDEHRIIYTMGKTGKAKNVLLPRQCIDLLAPYRSASTQPTDTLFPYLRRWIDAGISAYGMRQHVKSSVNSIRMQLIEVAEQAGINKALSAHVFRHSFADLARRNNMDVIQIQKALGHEQLNTTQGYMEDLEESAVDQARDLFR